MTILGTITGAGALITDGEEAPVQYSITVTQARGIKEGSGTVDGDIHAIMKSFHASQSKLRLSGGGEITVLVTQIGTPGGRAMIKVSGAVPGF